MVRTILLCALVACGSSGASADGGGADDQGGGDAPNGSDSAATGLHVVKGAAGTNSHIEDKDGTTVRLHGADRSGSEYACLNGQISDGPIDQAAIDVMKTWHLNAVRVPLNADCWLGVNGVPAASSGQTYRDAIRAYVTRLEQSSMYVILDLHWTAPGTEKANGQLGMADSDHAPMFWSQVAAAYAGDANDVIFDLFNEPFITDWECWLHGGTCAKDYNSAAYDVAGMAMLLGSVRGANATNLVMMGGLSYSSDFTMWLAKVGELTDGNIVASWHTYSDQSEQTLCPTQYNNYSTQLTCANAATTAMNYGVPPILAAGYPIIVGEIGIGAYASSIAPYTDAQGKQLQAWLEGMLTWLDSQGQGYVAWDWNTEAPPILLSSFDGTPSPYFGVTYKAHVLGL
jgi:endoglucanase